MQSFSTFMVLPKTGYYMINYLKTVSEIYVSNNKRPKFGGRRYNIRKIL